VMHSGLESLRLSSALIATSVRRSQSGGARGRATGQAPKTPGEPPQSDSHFTGRTEPVISRQPYRRTKGQGQGREASGLLTTDAPHCEMCRLGSRA
jgi:hypothetical protein